MSLRNRLDIGCHIFFHAGGIWAIVDAVDKVDVNFCIHSYKVAFVLSILCQRGKRCFISVASLTPSIYRTPVL